MEIPFYDMMARRVCVCLGSDCCRSPVPVPGGPITGATLPTLLLPLLLLQLMGPLRLSLLSLLPLRSLQQASESLTWDHGRDILDP